jgi:hypothetical protein
MKVKLNVLERMVAPQLFPEKGSYVDNVTMQGAVKALTITEEEIKKFEIVAEGAGQVKWHPEKGAEEVAIDLSDGAVALLKKKLKALDDSNSLEPKHVSLYEKFVVNAPSDEEKVVGKIDKKD